MRNRMRKHIDNNHTRNNKTEPDKSRQIQMLLKDHQPDKRDEDNPHPRPNRISNTYRNGFQHKAKAIKSTDIPYYRNDRGH